MAEQPKAESVPPQTFRVPGDHVPVQDPMPLLLPLRTSMFEQPMPTGIDPPEGFMSLALKGWKRAVDPLVLRFVRRLMRLCFRRDDV